LLACLVAATPEAAALALDAMHAKPTLANGAGRTIERRERARRHRPDPATTRATWPAVLFLEDLAPILGAKTPSGARRIVLRADPARLLGRRWFVRRERLAEWFAAQEVSTEPIAPSSCAIRRSGRRTSLATSRRAAGLEFDHGTLQRRLRVAGRYEHLVLLPQLRMGMPVAA